MYKKGLVSKEEYKEIEKIFQEKYILY
ncbi:MAG: SHOCT domain-containing protein [Lachnospirales bacterium]